MKDKDRSRNETQKTIADLGLVSDPLRAGASLRWYNPGQVPRVSGIGRAALSAGLARLP